MRISPWTPADRQVTEWLGTGRSSGFPYEAVLAAFHRGGKHAVSGGLLDALDAARARLPETGATVEHRRLASFLDGALDRHERRATYRTHLGLGLLPLLCVGDTAMPAAGALKQRDLLVAALISDLMAFELDTINGTSRLFLPQRPARTSVARRLQMAVYALAPTLARLGIDLPAPEAGSERAAQHIYTAVSALLSAGERFDLRLSLLPVDVMHDEYLFIRVTQASEAMLALLATDLAAAANALERGAGATTDRLCAAAAAFSEVVPLYSLMSAMNTPAVGDALIWANTIDVTQSGNYRLAERMLDEDRTQSAHALRRPAPSTDEAAVRECRSIGGALREGVAEGIIGGEGAIRIQAAFRDVAGSFRLWRRVYRSYVSCYPRGHAV